jgi:hypothetical protein
MRGNRITYSGLVVVGVAAALLSFTALAGLAALAGITGHAGALRLAWLVPVSIDAYAVTSTRVWLYAGVSPETRAWARANALTAVVASATGNVTYHTLTASGHIWVVVIVTASPPLMLGAAVHTAVLVSGDRRPGPAPDPRPARISAPSVRDTAESVPAVGPGTDRDDRDQAGPKPASPPTADARPEGGNPSRPGPGTRARHESTRRLELVSPVRGDTERKMRAHWDTERAAGRTPSGAELARVVDKDDSLGRRKKRQFEKEDTQRHLVAGERGTHTDLAGEEAAR